MPPILRFALMGAAVLVVVFVIITSFNPAQRAPAQDPGPEAPPPIGTVPLPPQLMATPVQAPPPGTEWNPVFTAAGADSLRTPPFSLSGNTVRIRFNTQLIEGNAAGIFFAYVMPENQASGQAGFPDIIRSVPEEGEVLITKPAGSYILNVTSFGCTWTVDVEEAA